MRKGVVIAVVVAAALFLVGVVNDVTDGDQESQSARDRATTSVAPIPVAPVGANAVPQTTATAPPTTTAPVVALAPTTLPATTAARPSATMPDVMCMNLQDAQDVIQQHGVFFSRSVDATGRGRHQVLDRNWVVVQQYPQAGSPIGEGDAVLSVVKYGEPNDCG